jgi:hypothetical protein
MAAVDQRLDFKAMARSLPELRAAEVSEDATLTVDPVDDLLNAARGEQISRYQRPPARSG